MIHKQIFLILIVTNSFHLCKDKPPIQKPPEQPWNVWEESIDLSKTQFTTIHPSIVIWEETLSLVGEVVGNPDHLARVVPKLSGRITSVHFKEGDAVQKGQKLIELESMEAARLRSKYLGSQSQYLAMERNAKRLRELVSLKLAGDQEAINAESQAKLFKAESESDMENLKLSGITISSEGISEGNIGRVIIRSPLTGVILTRDAIVGSGVDPNFVLANIGDLREVWFLAKIFEKDLANVQIGQETEILLNAFPQEKWKGKLSYISQQIDPGTRTLTARIAVQNPGNKIKLGLFGTAYIKTKPIQKMSLPETSIINIEGESAVFIQVRPGIFQLRKVKLGQRNESQVQILEGLSLEDLILSSDLYAAKSRILKPSFGDE
jgi:cobalt-zinc-cadmium efflux system membrane fusion protein